ncbi:NAD(P)/FAD-dependent oxidoreductase [Halegenticoccus tardaugens]|uniref:NAD(P)/FAD-dependent oxidoreductase n=1 Tax=Halegenticoccus tardaugens TaxID=2071624 RepID=UPI00100AB8D1|nr:FAD-binding oxidoreductase [Halegenticoccus tardaugens]
MALGSGTTAASIAQFIEHQDNPDKEEAARRRRAWSFYDLLVDAGTIHFDRIGTLHTASSEAELATIRVLATNLERVGITAELEAPTAMAHYGINPETIRGGLLLPDDGVFDPAEIVQYFPRGARAAGVTIETRTVVTDVRVVERRVRAVKTINGTVDAGTVVNAAGPWAPRVDRMVSVETPLRHTYGPILVLYAGEDTALPLTFFEGGYYLREEGDMQVFAGKFATDYEDATALDPGASHAAATNEAFHLEVADLLARHLPSLQSLDVMNSWVGLRPVTPDGYPLVGPTDVNGYVHATGMRGHGVTLSPVVGDLLAQLLTIGETPDLLRDYLPSRFD